jgi:hypothetical protein
MESPPSLEQYYVPIFCSVKPLMWERRAKNHLHHHASYNKSHLFGATSYGTRRLTETADFQR